ncbi:MAG TPA: SulP family inorganic anion transporter [Mycobacterium sp.]
MGATEVLTLAKALPVLQWVPGYQRSWVRVDLVAGLTVTAILVPEGMAYAQLAGEGPEAAFYAAPIGLLLYAIFGSSRQLVVAVSSAIAITSAATVVLLAPQGTAEYVGLTAALALLAGLISVVGGALAARSHRLVLLDVGAPRFRFRSRSDHLAQAGPEDPRP